MTYELALGFQTEPADSNLYDKLFGYPRYKSRISRTFIRLEI